MFTTLFDAIRTWFSVESLDHAIELVQRAAQIAEFDNNNRRVWVTARLTALGFSDHQAGLLCELAVGAFKPMPLPAALAVPAAAAQVTEGAGQPGTVTWPVDAGNTLSVGPVAVPEPEPKSVPLQDGDAVAEAAVAPDVAEAQTKAATSGRSH